MKKLQLSDIIHSYTNNIMDNIIMSYSPAFSQAVEIILYISIKLEGKQSEYLSIQGISEKLNIPVPSVKRLVGMLKNEGLVSSKSGVSGGLALQKSTHEITFYDVFKAVEGVNKPLFKMYKGFDISHFLHSEQVESQINEIEKVLFDAENEMLNVLRRKTIEQIKESE